MPFALPYAISASACLSRLSADRFQTASWLILHNRIYNVPLEGLRSGLPKTHPTLWAFLPVSTDKWCGWAGLEPTTHVRPVNPMFYAQKLFH